MVADSVGSSAPRSQVVPKALLDAREALKALSQPRAKSETEQRLDQILNDLKSSKSKAAKEAARRKLQQLKAKLEALKLAAGSAAATGDARLARRVAKEIRDAARELSRALAAAGEGGSGGVTAVPSAGASAPVAGTEKAAEGGAATTGDAQKAAGVQIKGAAESDDLATLKSEAQGLVKELKKIMRKLRETAMHKLDPKDRQEMDKMFREADRELAGLLAAAAPTPGMTVNLSA